MRKAILFTLLSVAIGQLSAQCIEGNCNNGNGIAIFKKKGGVKYTGNFKNKRPHGKGTAEYPNGRVYTGDWENGTWTGQGSLRLTDGTALEGTWVNSRFQGNSSPNNVYVANLSEENRSVSEFSNADLSNSPSSRRILTQPLFDKRKTDESKPLNNATPEIWAVAVGVAQYENQSIPTLKYPDNDAFSIYSFWKSPLGGSLDDDHSQILVDDAATKGMVTSAMRNTFSKAHENDLAIFFFSGHGLKGSFLTTDYDGDGIRLYHNEINKILTECSAKHKLVIADACHSGSYIAAKGVKSPKVDIYDELSKSNPGVGYLLSSQAEEESLEVSTLHNSVFTYFVLRGMKGEANSNNDNVVTIKELFNYVYLNVTEFAAKLGKVQTPMLKGNYDPNMPVAIVKK